MSGSIYYPVEFVLIWAIVVAVLVASYRSRRWYETLTLRHTRFYAVLLAFFFITGIEKFYDKAMRDPAPWVRWVAVACLVGQGILTVGAVALWIRTRGASKLQRDQLAG